MINARVKSAMINTCSSTDIFYFDAFKKLRLSTNNFTPMISSPIGFTRNTISPIGTMNLHVMFGDELYSETMMTKFMVVDIFSTYNAIIGQPTLNKLMIVVSTYHVVMKLPIRINVRDLRCNPKESCHYYLIAVSLSKKPRFRYRR
ncbi:unnamed protein product [Musa textilis]